MQCTCSHLLLKQLLQEHPARVGEEAGDFRTMAKASLETYLSSWLQKYIVAFTNVLDYLCLPLLSKSTPLKEGG